MDYEPLFSAESLLEARTRAGLTQHQLARLVNVAGGERVAAWEAGRAAPKNPRLIHALADALDVSVEDLLIVPSHGPDLRWLRTVAGLSVEYVAEEVGVSESTLKRWEAHGLERTPTQATVAALAKVLKTTRRAVADALLR